MNQGKDRAMRECKCGEPESINRYGHLNGCELTKHEPKDFWIHLTPHGWIVHFEPITSISKVIHVREVIPVPSRDEISNMALMFCSDPKNYPLGYSGFIEGFKKALELMGYRK